MDMQEKELQILNLALDGKAIYGLTEKPDAEFTGAVIKAVKESMIQKGILEDERELTGIGTQTAVRLMQYKNAYKYVHICNMIIGCYEQDKCIVLVKQEDEEYELYRENRRQMLKAIYERFPVFPAGECAEGKERPQEKVSLQEVLKETEMHRDKNIYVQEVKADGSGQGYLFSANEKGLFFYDMEKEILQPMSEEGLKNKFEEMFIDID